MEVIDMSRLIRISLIAMALVCGGCAALTTGGGVTVKDLKCEYLRNPIGIDTAKPRLSWVLESSRRGSAKDVVADQRRTTEKA
jgi:alpha-L-rhamnosidase